MFYIRQDLQDEHDKAKFFKLLGVLRIKEQLNPGYPVRIKNKTPGQSRQMR